MVGTLVWIVGAGFLLQALIGLSFFISSILENEKRASVWGFVQLAGMVFATAAFFYINSTGWFGTAGGTTALIGLLALGVVLIVLFVKRTPANEKALKGTGGYIAGNPERYDERDHVFSRNRSLRAGSEQYKAYYEKHPELEEMDAKRRAKGGPNGPVGIIDGPGGTANVAGTLASLNIAHFLSQPEKHTPAPHFHLKKKVEQNKVDISPQEAAVRLKGYAKALGSCLVGITKIDPLWIYSHRGEIPNENWEDWGTPIETHHTYAIVCAEQMTLDMVQSAPHTTTLLESMINYSKGAFITTQLAGYIANLGYSATANHLRHYDGLMVPMAVDAGLGEVGRMGYLITKKYGPRIRLSAVTTDLPLEVDKPVDIGVEDFCRICKKCAVCCPSNSIPDGEMTENNGLLRWKLEAQSCFEYWGKIGTDCNLCMRVCPWSHADTPPHQLIKALITRNSLSRKLFNFLDDVFYGKKPKPESSPKWSEFRSKKV